MSMARPSSRPCSVEQRDARACAADVAGVIWEQKEEKGDSVDAWEATAVHIIPWSGCTTIKIGCYNSLKTIPPSPCPRSLHRASRPRERH